MTLDDPNTTAEMDDRMDQKRLEYDFFSPNTPLVHERIRKFEKHLRAQTQPGFLEIHEPPNVQYTVVNPSRVHHPSH